MIFRALAVRHEELPWSWPLSLGSGIPTRRARCIITAWDDQGAAHQAELAPCPGVHPESLNEALFFWEQTVAPRLMREALHLERWDWARASFGLLEAGEFPMTSVQTALEQLLLSRAQNRIPEKFSLPSPLQLEGSALLALQPDPEANWREFLELWNAGFRLFKCKVGRQAAVDEHEFLQRLARHGEGELRLRLDANRSMTADDLLFWKEKSRGLPIIYWEEAAQLEPAALDESLWEADEPPSAAAWILKPSRLGLARTVNLLQKAAKRNIPCVLSNAFDSGLSLRCSAWIYAAFCAGPQPLGFGTGRFLLNDAWDSAGWAAPRVNIPERPFAEILA